jgi:hypothetical protein
MATVLRRKSSKRVECGGLTGVQNWQLEEAKEESQENAVCELD